MPWRRQRDKDIVREITAFKSILDFFASSEYSYHKERAHWFSVGLRSGDINSCDTSY